MSITDAKNGDLKSLTRSSGNGNGANGKDISTLKSAKSIKSDKSQNQKNEFSQSLLNPLKKLEQAEVSMELKPRFNEKNEAGLGLDLISNVAEKTIKPEEPTILESLSYTEEQEERKKQKAIEKDIKLLNSDRWIVRNGHTLSYVGVFLFSVMVYFRPYTWVPGLENFTSIALIIAIITLLIYVPTQLSTEGNITALTTEVKCVLFLTIWSLLTMPLAKDPGTSWQVFSDTFIKIVIIFIVMINTLRTKARLKSMMWVSVGVGVFLSVQAWNNYFQGKFAIDDSRVNVDYGGMFGNPNDLALHLVIFTPIAVALGLASKKLISKIIYFAFAILMIGGNMVTLSRGGFLGLVATVIFMVWKFSRGQRFKVIILSIVFGIGIIVFAPGNYGGRILSIFDSQLDASGSSAERRELLERSIQVTLRNPLGIGLGNFPVVGVRNLQTHNAFTQVSSELGWLGLIAYLILLISPFRKLTAIERQLSSSTETSWIFYLSIGIQASIIGYMVSSFFASVAYQWFIYYPIAYAVCLRRIYKVQELQGDSAVEPIV